MKIRFVSYDARGETRAGFLWQDRVYDAALHTANERHASIANLLADWDKVEDSVKHALMHSNSGTALADVCLAAPVPHPGAIYCSGANYIDHIIEMRGPDAAATARPEDSHPWLFVKASWTVAAPGASIAPPAGCEQLDWEAELAVVIGREAKDVAVKDALGIVAGFTIANDLSARDLFRRSYVSNTVPFHFDWLGQKSFDGACPLGPWIVPAKDIPDPQSLSMTLKVNGEIRQSSNTSKMVFSIAEQIAQVSKSMTLHPGDLILTGSPAGVGAGKGIFLQPGDVVDIDIEQIGTLSHSVVGR
jgi:2-keto-4-pentenoate hydratase/2-oxohepta-3-ene-1,7-dioic acid hydratase in catechol pathway